jgi:hypothetical protein
LNTSFQMETGLQMLHSLEQQQQQQQAASAASASSVASVEAEGPMSHDSNSALLLATVSPGAAEAARGGKRRKT